MKRILLASLMAIGSFSTRTINPEYQKMLETRANILGIPKPQSTQATAQPLPVLIQEEEALNTQFTDLLQQLKNLDSSKNYDQITTKNNLRNHPTS